MADQTSPDSQPPAYSQEPPSYQQGHGPAYGHPSTDPQTKAPMYPAQQNPVQSAYQPAPGQPVIAVSNRQPFGPAPVQVYCPQCNQLVLTKTEYENGMMVWAAVGVVLLFGGWLGCCLIPFCINDLKNVRHTCPNDNTVLGVYDRSRSF